MSHNDKAVPTGNPPVDATFAVRVKADFLVNGRPLTVAYVERRVRDVLKREFDDLEGKVTVTCMKVGQ